MPGKMSLCEIHERQCNPPGIASASDRYIIGVRLRMKMSQPLSIPGVTASSIDGELLWGFWYPALRSDELRGRALVTSMRMEVPLVLGRDAAGKAFALRDICPHRAFPLSAGHCDGQTVECTYHGWRFDAHTGQCREIPSITADSKLQCDRIYAGSFPCEERDGYVWVYLANPEGRAVDRAADGRAIP